MQVEYVPEDVMWGDDFKPPTQFFVVNALGEGVYFHTRSRAKAQEECDALYGNGKYLVRIEVKAGVR